MSKLKIDIDKKQMPQVVGLGVLSLGLVGYFSMRLLAPSSPAGVASAAATVGTRSLVKANVTAAGAGNLAQGSDASATDLTNGTAPMPGMRDPFIPLVTDTDGTSASTSAPAKTASALTAPGSLSAVPGLPPSAGSVQPLPGFAGAGKSGTLLPLSAPIAAPAWTVTGVLSGDDPATDRIAVLRQGDVRRFVRLGAMVDEQYRLIDITRSGVILGVGKTHFRLPLGGDTAKATPHVPAVNGTASAAVGASPTTVSTPAPALTDASAPASTMTSASVPGTPTTSSPSATGPTSDPFLDSGTAGKGPL